MKSDKRLGLIVLSFVGIGVFFLPLLEATSFWSALVGGIVLSIFIVLQKRNAELSIVILFCLLLHAQWGVAQFVVQEDINLRLLGEAELSSEKVGVAKFGSDKVLRAYGPYKHANSFAGIMILALSLWLVASLRSIIPKSLNFLSLIIVFAVIVSFSRSALMALFFLLLVLLIYQKARERDLRFVGLGLILFLLFTPFYIYRLSDSNDMGVAERLSGYDWSLQIIKDNGLWKGVGFGRYKEILKERLDEKVIDYNVWQIDYVHSVPLLGVAVLGFIPAIVLSLFLCWLLCRHESKFKLLVLLAIVPLLMFDHYLITQIAPFLLFMLLILI